MVLGTGPVSAAVLHDVAGNGDSRPNQRYGAQQVNAVENQHRREDNKRAGGAADSSNQPSAFKAG